MDLREIRDAATRDEVSVLTFERVLGNADGNNFLLAFGTEELLLPKLRERASSMGLGFGEVILRKADGDFKGGVLYGVSSVEEARKLAVNATFWLFFTAGPGPHGPNISSVILGVPGEEKALDGGIVSTLRKHFGQDVFFEYVPLGMMETLAMRPVTK